MLKRYQLLHSGYRLEGYYKLSLINVALAISPIHRNNTALTEVFTEIRENADTAKKK